jgi:hypothetical protein
MGPAAATGTLFAGDGWNFSFVLRPRRFSLGQSRKARQRQHNKH